MFHFDFSHLFPPRRHAIAIGTLAVFYVMAMIFIEVPQPIATRIAIISFLAGCGFVSWGAAEDDKMARSILLGVGYGVMLIPIFSAILHSVFGLEKLWPSIPALLITIGGFVIYEYRLKS